MKSVANVAKKSAVAIVSLLVLSSCVSKELRAIDDTSDVGVSNITVIAHRGASALAPENTFAAFDKAQDLGAVACETDLQLTKDGQLVLFHDDTLDAKTNLKGPVQTHTWAELSQVDLAPWFARVNAASTASIKTDSAQTPSVAPSRRARAGGVRTSSKRPSKTTKRVALPTNSLTRLILLDDLFERYGMTFSYNLQIRTTDDHIAALALQTVKEFDMVDSVTFTSLSADQLTRLRQLDKNISLCYLIDEKKTPDLNGEILRAKTLGFNEVSIRASVVTSDLVKRAKDAGLKIISWGPKTDDDMKHAVQAGVSGLSTDWPDRLMKILHTPIFR